MSTLPTIALHNVAQRVDADDANLTGSRFHNVRLADARFIDVNLSGAGFEDVTLAGATSNNANLSRVAITDCRLDGMTIEGIAVADLLAAYRAHAVAS
jgi:uncharacterized protein YjbI with pentapeptide repeats